jgi:glycosyltransferase involved in cell wall biosynthesis
MRNKLKVMMTTEGTYPFHHGGVSTWCDILVNGDSLNMDMTVYSVIMNPYVTQKFNLPKGTKLIKVPLWGTEEPSEHLDIPFSKVYKAKRLTNDKIIKEKFIPLFEQLIEQIIRVDKDSEKLGKTIYDLYKYFEVYEYKKSFKSEITWNFYKKYIYEIAAKEENKLQIPGSYSLIQSLGWVYRFMNILNTPIPKVDVTHSAAAAFCGIPCVIAKYEYNAPFILTEHGIYLREQYLSLSKRGYPPFLNTFLIRMIHSVVNLNYHYADQISPVCTYNTRWERELGVAPEKIQVIYNGVDEKVFVSNKIKEEMKDYITVVSIARIDPVKDIITLIKSADIVIKRNEKIKFIVYGSVTVQGYYEECLKLKEKLNLGDKFIFAGHTDDMQAAYRIGDIIALSSISEAFPYSVVEAMMSGKPVVTTDVGGIKEAIGECGIIVPPQEPDKLAEGILSLAENRELMELYGVEGRERALNFFTLNKAKKQYYDSYLRLTSLALKDEVALEEVSINDGEYTVAIRSLYLDKAYAFYYFGFYKKAVEQFKLALREDLKAEDNKLILIKLAESYELLEEYEKAENERLKVELLKIC